MSNYINQLMLERLVEEGLEKGLTQNKQKRRKQNIF